MPTSSAYPLPAPSATVLGPGPGCAWLTTIPPRTVNLVRSLVDTAAGYTTASVYPSSPQLRVITCRLGVTRPRISSAMVTPDGRSGWRGHQSQEETDARQENVEHGAHRGRGDRVTEPDRGARRVGVRPSRR